MQIELRCVFRKIIFNYALFLCSTRNATLPKMIWDGVRSEIDPTITSIASGIMEYKAENVKIVKEV